MTDARWSMLRDMFERVRDLPDADRRAVIERELAHEPEVRGELEGLLRAHDASTGFLADPPVLAAGSSVGPFRLIEPIGEGGFAVVYLAEQVTPIRRRVALKLIKPGMDSKQVIARFEAERQALALMDHSGIAQVFDAGETEAGRPYFAMEHVPGAPITAFADAELMPLRERLALFLQVCEAVQHAHQKGVIHRDLKPSNILVARRDGVAALKVIDFGIAKATGDTSLGGATMTREGMIVGTAGYMSPEQLGAIRAPIDTRSDIYSLGVLLYELLAGDLPYDRERLRNAPWLDAMQLVMADPPTPAERAARADTGETAGKRSTDARTLLRALRGELEWITLRAMEREPERRYASASELAADIRRYLADEPVAAAAPGALYRVSKFARRHRVGVTAAAVVLLAVLAGGIAAGIGFDRALKAERTARREAESATQVSEFLVGLFHASSPGVSGDSLTVRSLLDRGMEQITNTPPADPIVRARLLGAISDSYMNLEDFGDGLRAARASLAAAESARPRDNVEVARGLDKMANAFSMAGMSDSMPPLIDRAIALLSATPGGDPTVLASCYYRKARARLNTGALGEADSLIALSLAQAMSIPKPDAGLLIRIHSTRATLAEWQSRPDSAAAAYRRALVCSIVANEAMWTAELHSSLATTLVGAGQADSAVAHAQLGVDMARGFYAPDHRLLATALGCLAQVRTQLGQYPEAIAAQGEAVRILRAKGRANEQLSYEVAMLGGIHGDADQLEPAIRLTTEALAIFRASLGTGHYRVGETMTNLASYHTQAGHRAVADTLYRRAIEILVASHDQSVVTPVARTGYADLCLDLGRYAEADSLYARAWAGLDSSNASQATYCSGVLIGRARLRVRQQRAAEAETFAVAGMRLARGERPENDPQLLDLWLCMAEMRWLSGRPAEAIPMLARARRCGATDKDVSRYPLLAAARKRPDYPFVSSP